MSIRFALIAALACALHAQTPTQPAAAAAAKPADTPAPPAREPGLYAIIVTNQGTIVAKLFDKESPITVKNFVDLAQGRKQWRDPKGVMVRRPLFPGTTFHRIIPGFMIQGGDPTGTGAGDPGYVIPDEFDPSLKFDRPGRLAMANAGPKTGNCQFFITEVPTPHLNGMHTIFGQVVEGQDIVTKISHLPRGANDKPRTAVRMTAVTIKREGPPPAPPAKKAVTPAKKATTTTTPAKKAAATTTTTPKKTTPPATKK